MVKFEERSNKDIRFIIWNLDTNCRLNNDVYNKIGPAKSIITSLKNHGSDRNLVVAEIEIKPTGRMWFKSEDDWKELKGVDKFLYG